MEEQELFTMLDENGQEKVAKILDVIEINGQEYIIYSIDKNQEEDSIYASKIIKNSLGEEEIISITDEEERKAVFDIIRDIIENLD